MIWHVYIVKCSDESLYTGITKDVTRRVIEHNSSKLGAKSLKGKRPVSLVYTEDFENQTEAAKREREIKSWRRKYKLLLIEEKNGFTRKLSSDLESGFTRKLSSEIVPGR